MKKDADNLNNRIGNIIAELRKSKGFTQEKFAEIFNVSPSSMAHYEQGANPAPLNLIIRIADYFNVSVDYIIGRTNNMDEYKEYNKRVCADLKGYELLHMVSKISTKNQNIIKDLLLFMYNNRHKNK